MIFLLEIRSEDDKKNNRNKFVYLKKEISFRKKCRSVNTKKGKLMKTTLTVFSVVEFSTCLNKLVKTTYKPKDFVVYF